jgi:hypothetical protein
MAEGDAAFRAPLLRAAWRVMERVAETAIVLLVTGMVVACLAQVVWRYALSDPLTWSEEAGAHHARLDLLPLRLARLAGAVASRARHPGGAGAGRAAGCDRTGGGSGGGRLSACFRSSSGSGWWRSG